MARITLRQLLDDAAERGYGVPAFNINNMEQALAIMEAARDIDAPVILQASRGARSYAGDIMLGRIIDAGNTIVLADKFDRMALDRALANLMRAQRDLTADVLALPAGDIAARLEAWRDQRPAAIDRAMAAVASLTEGEITVSRLSVAAGLLADLARSA